MQSIHLFENFWNNKIGNIFLYAFPFFFIILADSILSFIFPIILNDNLNSSALMGLIMGLSSVAGLVGDFILPQVFKRQSWKFFFFSAILLSLIFPISVYLGATYSLIIFFILATISWGIYFELIMFSEQLFIVNVDKKINYSKDWGVLTLVWQLTAIVGPLIGSLLLSISLINTVIVIVVFQVFALIFYILILKPVSKSKASYSEDDDFKSKVNILTEFKYWSVLFKRIWPAVILGISVNILQATFWTLGGIFGQVLFHNPSLNWLIITLFFVPMMIGSLVIARLNPKKNFQRLSQLSLIGGSLALSSVLFLGDNRILVLIAIIAGGFLLSFAQPLNESIYSDLLNRLGKEKSHLLGISRANSSIAYIFTPIFAGILADAQGFTNAFGLIAFSVLGVSLLLLVFSPKKILLPQSEIKSLSELSSQS